MTGQPPITPPKVIVDSPLILTSTTCSNNLYSGQHHGQHVQDRFVDILTPVHGFWTARFTKFS